MWTQIGNYAGRTLKNLAWSYGIAAPIQTVTDLYTLWTTPTIPDTTDQDKIRKINQIEDQKLKDQRTKLNNKLQHIGSLLKQMTKKIALQASEIIDLDFMVQEDLQLTNKTDLNSEKIKSMLVKLNSIQSEKQIEQARQQKWQTWFKTMKRRPLRVSAARQRPAEKLNILDTTRFMELYEEALDLKNKIYSLDRKLRRSELQPLDSEDIQLEIFNRVQQDIDQQQFNEEGKKHDSILATTLRQWNDPPTLAETQIN